MVRLLCFSASLMLLAGPAMATPSDEAAQAAQQQQEFQAAMDTVFAEMMKPGPKQEGWDKGGVDIFKLIDAAPGGTKQNYLLTVDKDGERSITVVRTGALAPYVPASWKAVLHAGDSAQPSPTDDLTFAAVDGPFHFAGWDSKRRVNDAFCSTGKIGSHLYEGPAGKAGEIPAALVPVLFNSMVKRLQDEGMCWRYDRQGDGYRVTYFLEDGRSLPVLNDFGERVMIVQAGPVDQLLSGPKAAE